MDFNCKCVLRRNRCLSYWIYLSSMVVVRRSSCGAAFDWRHKTIGDTCRTDCTSMPRPDAPSSSSAHASDGTRFETLFHVLSWFLSRPSNGRLNLVSPDKVIAYMRRLNTRRKSVFWVDDTICIAEHRLAGPFDWANQEPGNNRKAGSNRVPSEAWTELEEGASGRGMEVQLVRQVSPIVL